MIKNRTRLFLPVILVAALSAPGWAQDAKSILNAAAKAMGTDNLKTLQYSGSGSSYDEKGQHMAMSSYTRQMDLNATTSNVRLVRMQGTPPAPQTVNQTVSADSPWNVQFDFWLHPRVHEGGHGQQVRIDNDVLVQGIYHDYEAKPNS